MNKSYFYVICLFVLMTVSLLPGCTYRLVKPEQPPVSSEAVKAARLNTAKFSYSMIGGITEKALAIREKALRDSFMAYGITDILKSEELQKDRINIVVYSLPLKKSELREYLAPFYLAVFMYTLGIVPFYLEESVPLEIQVITPGLESAKQVKILRSEYTSGWLMWLPLAFVPKEKTTDYESVDYQGQRRIFDGVVMELTKN